MASKKPRKPPRKKQTPKRKLSTALIRQRKRVPPPTNAKLSIELVPRPLWYKSNVRTILPRADWDLLRRSQYRRSGYTCDVCGGKGPDHPIECHEVWAYDETKREQTLLRLTGLCPACHECKHMGRARLVGRGKEALVHLREVNGWTPRQADAYVRAAFSEWSRRSAMEGWKLTVDWDSISREYGVQLSLHGSAAYPAEGTATPPEAANPARRTRSLADFE